MKGTTNHTRRMQRGGRLSAVALAIFWGSLLLMPGLSGSAPCSAEALPVLRGEAAVTHLKEQGLYHSLESAMAASRYRVREAECREQEGLPGAYYASNPAQHWTTTFTP